MIIGLDPAPRRIGWCVGDGSEVPRAGCWHFDSYGDHLGELAVNVHRKLVSLLPPGGGVQALVYEAPILMRHDTIARLRTLYGMGWEIERFAYDYCIPCREAHVFAVKREMTRKHDSPKGKMVEAALRCGVVLPDSISRGREDAADAFGVWKIGVRHFAPQYLAHWDALLFPPAERGALL